MKLYEKIYIPTKNNDSPYSLATQHGTAIVSKLEEQSGSFIVLTIEELRDVWNASRAEREWWHSEYRRTTDTPCPPGFGEYLTSKGINITENGK